TGRQAITVLGAIDGAHLGFVLPHEHLSVDNRAHLITDTPLGPNVGLTLSTLAQARLAPRSIAENIVLDDDAATSGALSRYRDAGGGTLVELTPIGMGRDLARFRSIAASTGVNVIAATGYYVERGHKGLVAGRSEESLAEEFIAELTDTVDGVSRCGVIGEIGISAPPHPDEWLVLGAALRAQAATGAPIWIHVTGRRPVPPLLDYLEACGRDLGRTVISHMDYDLEDLGDHERALRLGLGVEFDLFGFPIWNAGNFLHAPTDTQRVQAIVKLAELGHAGQLFVSHDVCMKMQLPDWGGFGYDHLLTNVAPVFDACGAAPGLIDQLGRENTRRLLCWADADVPA
ncbi:MAG: pter, partial [Acidimicrobiaceae bacterium]|nr:pter [Acidimicrobiaceae bacterium]